MYDKFFGSFLLNKKTFTQDELKNILKHMQDTRIKIGTIAMKEKLMTGTQVEEVFQLQKKTDKRFGEIAVGKGYLEESQIEKLLEFQSEQSNLQLGQAAVDLGYLNYEQLDNELISFENESGLSAIQLKTLEKGDTDEIIRTFINFEGSANSQIYYDYVSLFLRNVVRFLDQQPWIELKCADNIDDIITAYQYIQNDEKVFTAIGLLPDYIYDVAEKFAGIPVKGDMELAESSIMELLNLHNGIFTVNMSDQGVTISMNSPGFTTESDKVEDIKKSHQICINTAMGKINLFLLTV